MITAAIIIEALGAVQYFMAKHGAKQEVMAKAQRDMQESQRVIKVKTEVETALKNAEQSIRRSLSNPETSYCIASRIIMVNPHIIGVGVAFVPGYYSAHGKDGLYLPYTYDDQPSIVKRGKRTGNPRIQTRLLPFDYTTREWYRSALAGVGQWTDPYVGEGTLHVLMCTYSVAIKDKNGRIAGVLFADTTMEDATVLMNGMNSGIQLGGIVTLCIQLFSMLLMGFIIWRAVSASRRYKAQFVDPEKDHLIEQMAKLREVNNRLIKRNQALAEKNVELQNSLNAARSASGDKPWFG